MYHTRYYEKLVDLLLIDGQFTNSFKIVILDDAEDICLTDYPRLKEINMILILGVHQQLECLKECETVEIKQKPSMVMSSIQKGLANCGKRALSIANLYYHLKYDTVKRVGKIIRKTCDRTRLKTVRISDLLESTMPKCLIVNQKVRKELNLAPYQEWFRQFLMSKNHVVTINEVHNRAGGKALFFADFREAIERLQQLRIVRMLGNGYVLNTDEKDLRYFLRDEILDQFEHGDLYR